MISFGAPGADIAKVLSNARLFTGDGVKFGPVILLEMSETGFAAAGCDGYAVGRDLIGEPDGELVQISDDDAEAIEKFARSQRRSRVDLTLDGLTLTITNGDAPLTYTVEAPDARWPYVLDLLQPAERAGELQGVIAFACDRLTRFGRVKTVRDAPIDIRLEPDGPAPIALFKIGPTFRGMLKAIDREQSARNLDDQAQLCLWDD